LNGIWIRSQDKGLHNVISFKAPGAEYWESKIKCYSLYGVVCNGYVPFLGEYATKERALQVLDEIQQFIADCQHCKDDKMFTPAFIMPAE